MLTFQKKSSEFDEGSYSFVFFSDNRANKVFKLRPGDPKGHTKQVFESEVEAYERASKHKEVSKLVPTFYGQVDVAKITDEQGRDISNDFKLCYAYQMQQVKGYFQKARLPSDLKKMFQSIGIKFTDDVSVVLDDKGEIMCIIDFATEKYELEWN